MDLNLAQPWIYPWRTFLAMLLHILGNIINQRSFFVFASLNLKNFAKWTFCHLFTPMLPHVTLTLFQTLLYTKDEILNDVLNIYIYGNWSCEDSKLCKSSIKISMIKFHKLFIIYFKPFWSHTVAFCDEHKATKVY